MAGSRVSHVFIRDASSRRRPDPGTTSCLDSSTSDARVGHPPAPLDCAVQPAADILAAPVTFPLGPQADRGERMVAAAGVLAVREWSSDRGPLALDGDECGPYCDSSHRHRGVAPPRWLGSGRQRPGQSHSSWQLRRGCGCSLRCSSLVNVHRRDARSNAWATGLWWWGEGPTRDRGTHTRRTLGGTPSGRERPSQRIGSALSYCAPGSGKLPVISTNAMQNAQ